MAIRYIGPDSNDLHRIIEFLDETKEHLKPVESDYYGLAEAYTVCFPTDWLSLPIMTFVYVINYIKRLTIGAANMFTVKTHKLNYYLQEV